METQQVFSRFAHLSPDAQRIVADLVAFLDRKPAATASVSAGTAATVGAILLPALSDDNLPTTWPENPFADPEFFGAWHDRTDIGDSTEYVRGLRRTQWGAK